MTLNPSEGLNQILQASREGVWIEELIDGSVVMVCKAPTVAITAAYRGATCSFLTSIVSVDQAQILCLGLRIQDEPENPYVVMQPLAPSHVPRVEKLLESSTPSAIYFFDELGHCVLAASCKLQPLASNVALSGLRSSSVTPLDEIAPDPDTLVTTLERALDAFQKRIRGPSDGTPRPVLMSQEIPLALQMWKPIPTIEVSPTAETLEFQIDDDEGQQLERSVYSCFDSIYPGCSFMSPEVQRGNVRRELTDVLSFDHDSNHLCVVQTKALSVLQTNASRHSRRRTSSVEKDISKALKQLTGAIRRIRNGDQIYNRQGVPIVIPDQSDCLVHGIALVSEMYVSVDWRKICDQVNALSDQRRYGALFHVLDRKELQYLGAHAKIPSVFSIFLTQRWFEVKSKGTAYLRAKAPVDNLYEPHVNDSEAEECR